MNDAEDQRELNPSMERQQRILKAVKEELLASHEKLKQTLRQHDDIFYRLFPPVRPGRDPVLIASSIEESRKQLARLRQAIFDQRLELESLLQSASTFGTVSTPEVSPATDVAPTVDQGVWIDLVAEGRDKLAGLKKEFADTRLNLNKLEALLSPIRMLPMEVIGEIFTYCLETVTTEPMSLNCGPLLMTHVCSSWRAIAVNKSDLWTNISVSLGNNDNQSGWPPLVQLWVDRSKELPLTFHIQESDTHNYLTKPNSAFFRILDILAPQAHRWKRAELVNRNLQAIGEVEWFSKVPDSPGFPLLEAFILQARRMDAQETTRLTKMMRGSPRLHMVTWMVKTTMTMPALPWGQLTHLTLLFISSLKEARDILTNSPELQMLDLSVQILNGNAEVLEVTHNKLHTLYLSCTGNPLTIFDTLTLPGLRDLTIDHMAGVRSDNVTWPHDSFMAFLQRSKCELQRFVMMDMAIQDADLITLLRHTSPSLRCLEIENFDHACITENVLRLLVYPDPSLLPETVAEGDESANDLLDAILCPKLEELRLSGCMNAPDGVLADMVESRWSWPDDHSALRRLQKGDFSVHSPPERPMDRARLTELNSPKFTYNVYEVY